MCKLWWLLKLLKGIQKIIHLDHIYQLQEEWLQLCWIACFRRLKNGNTNPVETKKYVVTNVRENGTEQEVERYNTYKEAVTAAKIKV